MAIEDSISPPQEHTPSSEHSEDEAHSPPNAEGVPRQKRKKARRACAACQRAHLTCGNERPCLRCVKRGLQDSCHDGKRKKAKYLHDASDEALLPGASQTYVLNDKATNDSTDAGVAATEMDERHNSTAAYTRAPIQLSATEGERSTDLLQDSRGSPYQNLSDQTPQQRQLDNPQGGYTGNYYDPADPSMFNFDLASMNFGNHYGALEFGMLGHLSSGADDNLLQHESNANPSALYGTTNLGASVLFDNFGTNAAASLTDWQANSTGHGLQMNTWNQSAHQPGYPLRHPSGHAEPYAYAIGAVAMDPSQLSTSSSNNSKLASRTDRKYSDAQYSTTAQPPRRTSYYQNAQNRPSNEIPYESGPSEAIASKLGTMTTTTGTARKRRRDPSSIYSLVTKPYPYTSGFHALTAYLQRRFSSQKRLAIAQALASIRPSFISCTRTLIDDDLVFMEKCFQRQLVEYEDFIGACGTPTIVCRRTGEIAYAGEEFSLLSGWTQDVLLGKVPNLNINSFNLSGAATCVSSRNGVNTPYGVQEVDRPSGADSIATTQQQAIFLAEILDDDSVVSFYEDFAKLAFADSKGSAWCACKLLKYRNKDDSGVDFSTRTEMNSNGISDDDGFGALRQSGGDNQAIISSSAARAVRNKSFVDCMYCWTVRRDVFDIPNMLVCNFLPIVREPTHANGRHR